MLISSRASRRRFVPALDRLPTRLNPSDASAVLTVAPIDPVMLGPDDPTAPNVVVEPMDPVMLGPDDPTAPNVVVSPADMTSPPTGVVVINPLNAVVITPAAAAPCWAPTAGLMGDMLNVCYGDTTAPPAATPATATDAPPTTATMSDPDAATMSDPDAAAMPDLFMISY